MASTTRKAAPADDPSLCAFETLEQRTTPGTLAKVEDLDAWARKHAPS